MTGSQPATAGCARLRLRIDASEQVSLPGTHHIALSVTLPPAGIALRDTLLFCLPGGGMTNAYFDLDVPEDASYSLARTMAARGYVVASADHLGIGASSVPEDGFALRVEHVTAANQAALAHVLGLLADGTLSSTLPKLPHMRSVGVGHSMGGLFTVLQQGAYSSHAGLVLLGYSNNGLRDVLPPAILEFAGNAVGARAALNDLLHIWPGKPFFDMPQAAAARAVYQGGRIAEAAVRALGAAHARGLAVGALLSMITGSAAPEMERIDVPLFLGIGAKDIAGSPGAIPASFPRAPYCSLAVLPDTGHNHFVYPTRTRLLALIAHWLEVLPIVETS